MLNKVRSQIATFALILSLVSLVLAGYSLSKAGSAILDDKTFSARVEKGINDYIDKQKAAQGQAPQQDSGPVNVDISGAPMMGQKNAPVTIVEFSDFECPFCGRFYQTTLPQIVSDYINKGSARLVYRNFPLSFHKESKNAALAAACARDQGGDATFFKYHDKLYENQTSLGVDNYKKWAVDLGLNASKFNDCYDKQKYSSLIDKDIQDGSNYGVNGTPAFFINGTRLTGAQPFSAFKTIIDQELAKTK